MAGGEGRGGCDVCGELIVYGIRCTYEDNRRTTITINFGQGVWEASNIGTP